MRSSYASKKVLGFCMYLKSLRILLIIESNSAASKNCVYRASFGAPLGIFLIGPS